MTQWKVYSEKFSNISIREQYLIIFSGVAAIIFIIYTFFLDESFQRVQKLESDITKLQKSNKSDIDNIALFKNALKKDPNVELRKEIAQYIKQQSKIDNKLSDMTSNLIDPVQMRHALIEFLKQQKDVSLLSFTVLPASALVKNMNNNSAKKQSSDSDTNQSQLQLYRHEIKIKLQGPYFQLRNYLIQLENLDWKFFWQNFNYKAKEYPLGELEINIYSLSTSKEFIGV